MSKKRASETQDEQSWLTWLVQHSMLENVKPIAARYAGQGKMWQHPYAATRPHAAADRASVWFTAYPAALITRTGESVLHTLGDERLWQSFQQIGIEALHTGPMKKAGGLTGYTFTPTVDGHFDRIGLEIDASFGTQDEFVAMSKTAQRYGGTIIEDIIPGHTGKGADFRLAERNYGDYPGLYHMVEIRPEDWALLPAVPPGEDAVNLPRQRWIN